MNMPFVEIVGAGPGAEDLITMRGLRALQQADLVVYAGSLVAPALLRHCRPDCLCRDSASMDLAEQVAVMSEAALAGKRVVRLHTGDPALYGAIDEQIRGLAQRGITVRITPGVSSVFAAAAALGCELTGPETAQSVVLTRTPGRTPMPAGEQAATFARTGATLAFFLSTGKVADLMQELQDAGGLAPDTPAAAVYRASWPDEQVVRSTVADLARKVEEAGFRRQSLILVGRALAASAAVSRLYDGDFSHGYRNSLPDEAFHGTCALYAASPAGLAQARTLAAALAQGDAPAPVIFASCPADDQQPAPQPVTDMAAALTNALPRFEAHIILGTPRQALPLLPAATGGAAVICCAESGRHAVCLLDGPDHAGDRLTRRVARITGGLAITGPAGNEGNEPAAVSPADATASLVSSSRHGQVLVVGLGSGDPAQLTPEVDAALRRCDTVAGYSKYVDFIRDRIRGKRLIETGMKGEVERSELSYIIRDHDMEKFEEKKAVMTAAADFINRKYGAGTLELTVKDSYYNMKKCIEPCMYVVERAKKAMAAAGMNPVEVPIRGGTDGARLSYEGLPCPNLCTGGENYHGRFEFIPTEDMEKCVRMLVEILTA